jgi:hypothetical protein
MEVLSFYGFFAWVEQKKRIMERLFVRPFVYFISETTGI